MHYLDYIVLAFYFLGLWFLGRSSSSATRAADEFFMAGRRLTAPAFMATLVATWYGGILGVGEFNVRYGLAQWSLFGLPYYVAALIYAVFLIRYFRQKPALTLPALIRHQFGEATSYTASAALFLLLSPAPYLLMLGMVVQTWLLPDVPVWLAAAVIGVFSVLYIQKTGFKGVVRTDFLQFALMMISFSVLAGVLVFTTVSPTDIWRQLPVTHRQFSGGLPFATILAWFLIATWTFVDPGFHQRVMAAKTDRDATRGLLAAVGCWLLFDMLTLWCGFYGQVLLTNLQNPAMVYPELALQVLPVGLRGLFFAGLLSVIMSTLDSNLFLSGQILGFDVFPEGNNNPRKMREGFWVSLFIGVIFLVAFPGVVELWYVLGSIGIPGLLVLVVAGALPTVRARCGTGVWTIPVSILGSVIWLLSGLFFADSEDFMGIPPFFAGLAAALAALVFQVVQTRSRLSAP